MTSPDPRARIGDADRERTVAELQRYAAEGYLSLDEFSERSAAAYHATTGSELTALTGDLAPLTADRVPGAGPDRTRAAGTGRLAGRTSWSPVVVVVVVLVGAVLLAAVFMVLMMLGMMGGMDMGEMMGGMGGGGMRQASS